MNVVDSVIDAKIEEISVKIWKSVLIMFLCKNRSSQKLVYLRSPNFSINVVKDVSQLALKSFTICGNVT